MCYIIKVLWLAVVSINNYSIYTTLNPLRSLALRYNMVGNWPKRFHRFPARIVLTLENDN